MTHLQSLLLMLVSVRTVPTFLHSFPAKFALAQC